MGGGQHDVKSISATATVKAGHGKIIAIYVTKAGAAGDKVDIRDGTADTDTLLFTVEGESVNQVQTLSKVVKDGIRAVVTGTTARYLFVFE